MNPFTFSLLILIIFIIQSSTIAKPFNISHYIYPNISEEHSPNPYLFLQGVLKTVAEKEKWKVEDIRVSKLEVGKVKYGVLRFQMELQRDIRSNDTHWSTMAEWRTRPTVERVWFEAMARIEMRKLKHLMVKRVKPIIGVDSWAWSTLMSNISFTKFPSDLVTHDPLTLDVKW